MNWQVPPLLEVSTDEDDEQLERLLDDITPEGTDGGRGRWHWLIGSPGNGKSAKLGKLVRRLEQRGYVVVREDDVPIGEGLLDQVPYMLEVREPTKRYAFACLVQDASVVRSPFDAGCDPAQDLMRALESACEHGQSLVVCTNWGVLDRLFDLGHSEPAMRENAWWSAVRGAVSPRQDDVVVEPHGRKPVFDLLEVTYEPLDHKSMLVNSDVFDLLVQLATNASSWASCEGCPSIHMCPMKANRDDLASEPVRERVLDVLRRAEVLDGQVIVFREAVALLSLLLAGCPNDHRSGSPCQWVHDKVSSGAAFHLLARRISMLLFGSHRPCGLEFASATRRTTPPRRDQDIALSELAKILEEGSPAGIALMTAMDPEALSVDVGVKRLVGAGGAIPRLDPALDPSRSAELDSFFADVEEWNKAPPESHVGAGDATLGAIERHCIGLWNDMIETVETADSPAQATDVFFWLRRWQTTCMTWWSTTSCGLTRFQEELDEYIGVFQATGREAERLRTIRTMEENLHGLLAPPDDNDRGTRVELASSMYLTGSWVDLGLRPEIDDGDTARLCIKMGKGHEFVVTAETFATLRRRHDMGLSDVSFKTDVLEALKRARAQAAALGDYSVVDDQVALVVVDHRDEEHRRERVRGVLLSEDGGS